MECVGIGDLHLPSAAGTGALSKYVQDPSGMVLNEASKVCDWARNHGISTAIYYGDIFDAPRGAVEGVIALNRYLKKEADMMHVMILGNHDMFGDTIQTGHSFELMQEMCTLPNVRFITEPVTKKIDGVRVRFLPFPHDDFDDQALNIFHKEVYGSKGDTGRVMKGDHYSKSKAVVCSGHLHTAQQIRNTYYSGTLYQTNFGESLPKYFHHINFNSVKDYEIELIDHDPTYKLHNIVIAGRDDLANIPKGKRNLVKLVIQDGADISASDYSEFSNIVMVKNFKSKEDLHAVLTEDLANGEELIVQVDDFFDAWLESLDVEEKMRTQISEVRKRVLNKVIK